MSQQWQVALVGYGRFGAALSSLLEARGLAVRAFDPYHQLPDGLRADSLGELVAGATHVVVCVPFGTLEDSLRALAAHLGPGHLVLDVCSVKVRPVRALERLVPSGTAWAGTHPLFGPTTLKLNERPLRAVVTEGSSPDAEGRARAFYEALGCEVLQQTADAHDRCMAESHLAACFLAEGLINAGFRTDQPFVTPSFRSLERVMAGVAAEADHLRAAVYQGNPYAKGARERLLEALLAIDRSLDVPPPRRSAPGARLPDTTDAAKLELTDARADIDALDQELVHLLARRAVLGRRIFKLKEQLGQGVLDPAREDNLFRVRRVWGSALGLDADAVEQIFRAVVEFSRGVQHATKKQR